MMDVKSLKPTIHRVLCIVQQIGILLINNSIPGNFSLASRLRTVALLFLSIT